MIPFDESKWRGGWKVYNEFGVEVKELHRFSNGDFAGICGSVCFCFVRSKLFHKAAPDNAVVFDVFETGIDTVLHWPGVIHNLPVTGIAPGRYTLNKI